MISDDLLGIAASRKIGGSVYYVSWFKGTLQIWANAVLLASFVGKYNPHFVYDFSHGIVSGEQLEQIIRGVRS